MNLEDRSKIEGLERAGYTSFPGYLSPELVEGIRGALEKMPCIDPWSQGTAPFEFNSPPVGTHVGQIPLAPTLDILHELATRADLVDLVASYFGCTPVLDSIQAWWSYPGNDTAKEAENFHRDNESIRFLKFFIYLTDVDSETGPHVLVEGSSSSPKLTMLRRLSDNEVETEFGAERIKCIFGKAGDAFIEDTFGIHKGQLPKSKRRLLVQFRYSVLPTIFRSPIVVERNAGVARPISSMVSLAGR